MSFSEIAFGILFGAAVLSFLVAFFFQAWVVLRVLQEAQDARDREEGLSRIPSIGAYGRSYEIEQFSRFLSGEMDPVLLRRWSRALLSAFCCCGALIVLTFVNLAVCFTPMEFNDRPHCIETEDGSIRKLEAWGKP